MTAEQMEWLKSAIDIIKGNFADRVDRDGIVVYWVNGVIRIDIK